MPLTGPVSFVPVADEFVAHWTGVDKRRGKAGALTLHGGVNRGTVADIRKKMEALQATVTKVRHTRESEQHDLIALDEAIARRLEQFNNRVAPQGRHAETPEKMAALWLELERSGVGFQLPTAYDRLDFVTDLSARKLVTTALAAAERALKSARGNRDNLQDQLRAFLEMYRDQVESEFPRDAELKASLPKLGLPRATLPAAVQVVGVWMKDHALLTWSTSEGPKLSHYEVRGMPGSIYEAEDEMWVGRVEGDEPCEFETSYELGDVGFVATFKIYTVLKSGHEMGSNAVVVKRP